MTKPLSQRRCKSCEGGVEAMNQSAINDHLEQVAEHWKLSEDGKAISAEFTFRNYYQTTAFINAIAWVAHQEDHHPDISFGYKTCTVLWSTHAVGGLSENDFICAAKVDLLCDDSDS